MKFSKKLNQTVKNSNIQQNKNKIIVKKINKKPNKTKIKQNPKLNKTKQNKAAKTKTNQIIDWKKQIKK